MGKATITLLCCLGITVYCVGDVCSYPEGYWDAWAAREIEGAQYADRLYLWMILLMQQSEIDLLDEKVRSAENETGL